MTSSTAALPDSAFLHVGGDGERKFPYMDSEGKVDALSLRGMLPKIRFDEMLHKSVRARLLRRANRIIIRNLYGKSASIGALEYKAMVGGEMHANEAKGQVDMYVAAFDNQDGGDDILYKGATVDSVQERFLDRKHNLIRVLYGHNPERVLGHPLEMSEDNHGLLTKSQYNMETFWGNEVFHLVKAGDLNTASFGYLPADHTPEKKSWEYDDNGRRHLHRVDVYEFGPLPFSMNTEAHAVGVKSGLDHATSFTHLADQAINSVTDFVVEAMALDTRRFGKKTAYAPSDRGGRKQLSAAHVESLEEMVDVAENAVRDLKGLIELNPIGEEEIPASAGQPEEQSPETVADSLKLQLELARASLKNDGLEV